MNSTNVLNKEKTELNKKKSKDLFKNLKSDYFLQILFGHLLKKKSLNMVKYNKDIKNRINININEYKEFSESFSSIEIEVILINSEYDKFIDFN